MANLNAEANKSWGLWRQFIAKNPLTGWYSGIALGAVIVSGAWKIFG